MLDAPIESPCAALTILTYLLNVFALVRKLVSCANRDLHNSVVSAFRTYQVLSRICFPIQENPGYLLSLRKCY